MTARRPAATTTSHLHAVSFVVPIKLPSLSNVRMHWRALDRLKHSQKQWVKLYVRGWAIPCLPAIVTITRIGPRKLDDDNLQSACKYVRDEIARVYGVDDGSELYEWRYAQEKGTPAVRIEIEAQ